MAASYGWSTMKNRNQSSSVFHNLNRRPFFGSDVVQPYLVNSSKGMCENCRLLSVYDLIITRANTIETWFNSKTNKCLFTDKSYQQLLFIKQLHIFTWFQSKNNAYMRWHSVFFKNKVILTHLMGINDIDMIDGISATKLPTFN